MGLSKPIGCLAAICATLGCAGTLNMVVDGRSTTDEQLARWQQAADRIEQASGMRYNLAVGECPPKTFACIATVEEYEDKPNRIGEGGTILVAGWATVLHGLEAETELQTMTHELLHAAGVPHITSDDPSPEVNTIMFPISGQRRDCISDAELTVLCGIRECATYQPECEAPKTWRPILKL